MRVLENGCAHWDKGSIVEVGIFDDDHDPNHYRARCLNSGTFPLVQLLDNERYPDPIQVKGVASLVVIYKELAASDEEYQQQNKEPEEVVGMFIIIGCKPGTIRVGRKESDDIVEEGFESIEAARDWIDRNECDACGFLKTDPAGPGCTRRHLGAPKDFSF